MVETILLKTRPDLANSDFVKDLISFIEKRDVVLYLETESVPAGETSKHETMELRKAKVDTVIIVGGDGTILYTIRNLPLSCPPILGVDLGTTGFLTEITPAGINKAIERIINGDYEVEYSMRLKAFVDDLALPDALNEVLVATEPGKMVKLDVYINNQFLNRAVADGLITATATGSTAYGLSAGGPIIDIGLEAYTIVPVSPFKASFCPFVLSANKVVSIKSAARNKPLTVVIDGQVKHRALKDNIIKIMKSKSSVPFIRFGDNFYTRVREKLLAPYFKNEGGNQLKG